MMFRPAPWLILALMVSTSFAAKLPQAAPSAMVAPDPVIMAAALRDRALTDTTAYEMLTALTTEIGPRPAGSPAAERAKDWALAKLTAMGFQAVHAEAFAKPSWERGKESADIVVPYPLPLAVLGLGGTVPTPAGGLEATVVVFPTLTALKAAPEGSLAGKIALVNEPMVRTQTGEGYGYAVQARYAPSLAASKGAIAYLTRSVSTSNSRLPHTGQTIYAPGVAKIPAAAVGVPDAEQIARLAAKGPVRIRLSLESAVHATSTAWNVSGEIPGSTNPDERIVIGGHLDSWDPGTGAIDDGAGVAITAAAAKLIGDLPRHPRRTIRVVWFGSEETGGSSEAYLDAHKGEVEKIIAVSESDFGADRIWSLQLPSDGFRHLNLQAAANVLSPLKILADREPAKHGGSDFEGLQSAGVPIFSFRQDGSRYFDWHHTADDTLDKVDPQQLNQNVAAWAALLYLLADSDATFRKPAAP